MFCVLVCFHRYKTSIFTHQELTAIRRDVNAVVLRDETKSSVARKRKGAKIDTNSDTLRILAEGSLSTIVKDILGPEYTLSTAVPVEVSKVLAS